MVKQRRATEMRGVMTSLWKNGINAMPFYTAARPSHKTKNSRR
jgi:hypothetical protein